MLVGGTKVYYCHITTTASIITATAVATATITTATITTATASATTTTMEHVVEPLYGVL